jgi:hypothetical protein
MPDPACRGTEPAWPPHAVALPRTRATLKEPGATVRTRRCPRPIAAAPEATCRSVTCRRCLSASCQVSHATPPLMCHCNTMSSSPRRATTRAPSPCQRRCSRSFISQRRSSPRESSKPRVAAGDVVVVLCHAVRAAVGELCRCLLQRHRWPDPTLLKLPPSAGGFGRSLLQLFVARLRCCQVPKRGEMPVLPPRRAPSVRVQAEALPGRRDSLVSCQ